MRLLISFVLAICAAYSFSAAVDFLIGGFVGVYSDAVALPVASWSAISFILLMAARALIGRRLRWLSLPYAAIGVVAFLGAAVGPHRYSFGVAGLLFLQSYLIVRVSPHLAKQVKQSSKRASDRRPSCFSIGAYKIDESVKGIGGLREFSADEYAIMGRTFVGEECFNAPAIEFLGRTWNLMLGTVSGKVYRIAIFLELQSKQEANSIATTALQYCIAMLGKPASQITGMFTWDTTDGNVLLQTAETVQGLGINLFVTSRTVRNYRRA